MITQSITRITGIYCINYSHEKQKLEVLALAGLTTLLTFFSRFLIFKQKNAKNGVFKTNLTFIATMAWFLEPQ